MKALRALIAPISLVVLLSACTDQKRPAPETAAPPPPAPSVPPAAALPPPPVAVPPEPSPPPQRPIRRQSNAAPREQAKKYSVPPNTRDPVLVEKGVREWLAQHADYDAAQKAAILKRMRVESAYDPCVSSASGKYHHLLQWGQERLRGLYHHAKVRPGTCPSWLAQLEYMDREIKSNDRYASFLDTKPRQAYAVFSTVYLGGKI